MIIFFVFRAAGYAKFLPRRSFQRKANAHDTRPRVNRRTAHRARVESVAGRARPQWSANPGARESAGDAPTMRSEGGERAAEQPKRALRFSRVSRWDER